MVGNKCGKVKVAIKIDDCKSELFIWYTRGSFGPRFINFMSYPENDPNNFILVLKLNYVQKISRGGWSGFGMETVGIHPNECGVLNGHPNKIPTNEMLGDVVKNCPLLTYSALYNVQPRYLHMVLLLLLPPQKEPYKLNFPWKYADKYESWWSNIKISSVHSPFPSVLGTR